MRKQRDYLPTTKIRSSLNMMCFRRFRFCQWGPTELLHERVGTWRVRDQPMGNTHNLSQARDAGDKRLRTTPAHRPTSPRGPHPEVLAQLRRQAHVVGGVREVRVRYPKGFATWKLD